MGIQYVTPQGGRRLMPPNEREALRSNYKHNVDRAVGVEEARYPAGDAAGNALREKDLKSIVIVYTRFWSSPRWRFVVEARAKDGRVLAQTENEVYGERGDHGARFDLEDMLRADKIIK